MIHKESARQLKYRYNNVINARYFKSRVQKNGLVETGAGFEVAAINGLVAEDWEA